MPETIRLLRRRGTAFLLLLASSSLAGPLHAVEETRRAAAGTEEPPAARRDRQRGPEWRFEFFGRAGAHLVAASSRVEAGLEGFGTAEPFALFSEGESGAAGSYLLAGGVRVARGRTGLEISWNFAPNRLLSPTLGTGPLAPFGRRTTNYANLAGRHDARGAEHGRYYHDDDDDYDDYDDDYRDGPDARALLLVGQVFHEAPLFRTGRARLFVGAGGGWLRVRDEGSDRLPQGQGDLIGLLALAGRGLPAGFPTLRADFRLDQQRDRALVGGSLGLTFEMGNLVVRPRADMFWARALSSEAVLTVTDAANAASGGTTFSESIRPAFFLFSVDFGFAVSR